MPHFAQFVSFLLVAVAATNSLAADPKQAVTDLSGVDADFAFQGEYLGSVQQPYCGCRWLGLQVVAQGDGKFMAAAYEGGLPGYGWFGGERRLLEGLREENAVTLLAPGWIIRLENGAATVDDSSGQRLGRLQRVDRVSPTLGAAPPAWSTLIFDGSNTDQFKKGRMTDDHLLMAGADFANVYRDFSMHIEFRLPYMPAARGQGRGNSGVYIQSRYEVQILDSFGLEGKDNECAGLYKQRPPDINMCLPPLAWQTYDIDFRAPRFDSAGSKLCNAVITVRHNGYPVHNNVEVTNKTGGGAVEGENLLPIKLQDHGNPVVFRNIWLVDHSGCCQPVAACMPRGCQPASPGEQRPLAGNFSGRSGQGLPRLFAAFK